jgi:hypothetical protein
VTSTLSPDERLREVAAILAAGVARLRLRAALPGSGGDGPGSEKPPESAPNCLEVSAETRLSVHSG